MGYVDRTKQSAQYFKAAIKERIAPLSDVPIIFTSVLTKLRIHKVLSEAIGVYKNRKQRISTNKLNKILSDALELHHPPVYRGS